MKIVERTPRRGKHQCDMAGCIRSARFDMILLSGANPIPLCSICMEGMRTDYDNALSNWADEFKEAA
jgi:hypothetical protein